MSDACSANHPIRRSPDLTVPLGAAVLPKQGVHNTDLTPELDSSSIRVVCERQPASVLLSLGFRPVETHHPRAP
jgi:hypothetical protein